MLKPFLKSFFTLLILIISILIATNFTDLAKDSSQHVVKVSAIIGSIGAFILFVGEKLIDKLIPNKKNHKPE